MRLTVGVELKGKFTARGAAFAIERNGGVGVNRDPKRQQPPAEFHSLHIRRRK